MSAPLPKNYDWDKFRTALHTLAGRFPDFFPLWVLVGGGACWFYRLALERAADPDFCVPVFSPAEEGIWLSKDVDFIGLSRAEAEELLGAPVKEESRTISFEGLEVDFVEVGLHMTEDAVVASARLVHTADFDFYVADAAVLYDEKCALLTRKERPQDRLHSYVLAAFLKHEFCDEVENPVRLNVRRWLRRARIVKTADHTFFESDSRLIQRLILAIQRLGPKHQALVHWAKHHLLGFNEFH